MINNWEVRALPLRLSEVGFAAQVRAAAELEHVRLTVPAKLSIGVTVIVAVAEWPLATVIVAGETEIPKSVPAPERATVWVAGEALSLIVSVPVCAPAFDGANFAVTVQLPPAPTVPMQLLVSVKPDVALTLPKTCSICATWPKKTSSVFLPYGITN